MKNIKSFFALDDTIPAQIGGLIVVLVLLGLMLLHSASLNFLADGTIGSAWLAVTKQGLIILVGMIFGFGASLTPAYIWRKCTPLFFAVAFGFMVLLFTGFSETINGSNRWLNLYIITVQPSEIYKIAFVFITAYIGLHGYMQERPIVQSIALTSILVCSSIISYLISDLDLIIIFLVLMLVVLSQIKLAKKIWLILISIITIGAMLLYLFLPVHVRARIDSFLQQTSGSVSVLEKYDGSYQTSQSIQVLKSGGWFGNGPNTNIEKFATLPEAETDSIFPVIISEWGFFGGALILFIYSFLFFLCLHIAGNTTRAYDRAVISGFVAIIALQVLMHLLSAVGGPVGGVPLPLISKGGSSALITLFIFGIIVSFYRDRKKN
ncbi:MAG: FtsW/RodA/SpoVE family cell cycle protein [Alphaproteobacteria bacterium]|nr:FtsW/RodA/SpoVE family cell cycle protein [Alphaproteobacteria bacterium]